MNGPHEKILNDLMEGLGKGKLGKDGFNVTQEHIIGAHRLPPSPGEKTATTRITLDSQDTKLNIRLAAERGKVFGDNGTRSPFFRDITLDLRKRKSSKSEDTNVSKKDKHRDNPSSKSEDSKASRKDKHRETPRKGGDPKGRRPAPPGTHNESKFEERVRTVAQRQKEVDRIERERIQIKKDQQDAKRAKLEHQRREEEEAQERAERQPVNFNALPVQQFTAINEDNLQEDPPGTPENTDTGSARFTISETDESIEVFPKIT